MKMSLQFAPMEPWRPTDPLYSMTIIFNYLFTATSNGFKTRLPVRLPNGTLFPKAMELSPHELRSVNLAEWEGKHLDVTIREGVYSIHGLANMTETPHL